MHTTLIAVHAAAATAALAAGLAVPRRPAWLGVHAAGTVLMTLTLAGAVWVGRGGRTADVTAVFAALLVLALVMSWRGVRAWWEHRAAGGAASAGCVAAVGFNCISLVTGLLAVSAVRAGWGPAAVVAAGVLPTLVGRVPLNRAVRARRAAGGVPGR